MKNQNIIRLYIIERTILIEEHISETIGYLLGIDWKNSKSFGSSNSSISFSQKVQIIQDLKKVSDKDENVMKLTCLMQIRNKFAHVSDIDSFEKLFSNSKVGKEIKKILINGI